MRKPAATDRPYLQSLSHSFTLDCVVLHEDRRVLEHSQQLLRLWLAEIGLTLHETKSHIRHTLEGKDPGFEFLGFHIRQYLVGKHQSGKRPGANASGIKP